MAQEQISFFEHEKKYGELSNFYPAPLVYKGLTYSTSEHLYHALKWSFDNSPEANNRMIDKIRACNTPYKAKILANVYKKQSLRFPWQKSLEIEGQKLMNEGARVRADIDEDSVRLEIMLIVLRCKFTQDLHCKQVLLSTKDALLIERSPYDMFWGGLNEGQNHLGVLLMQVRKELATVHQ